MKRHRLAEWTKTNPYICYLCCAVLSRSVMSETLCDPMDCSPPGSSVHGDSLGKNTGEACMPSSRWSSQARDRTTSSELQAYSLVPEPPGKPKNTGVGSLLLLQGDVPDPGIEMGSPELQADSLPAELPRKPIYAIYNGLISDLNTHTHTHTHTHTPSDKWNQNTMIQNLWDGAKAVLQGKFTVIQTNLRKWEKFQINNLTLYLSNWKKKHKEYPKLAKGKKSKGRELQT